MSSFLSLKHNAIDTLWCNTKDDNNVVFKAAKLSDPRGNIGAVNLPIGTITLPDNSTRFILLSLGTVSPDALGLFTDIYGWTTLANLTNNHNVLILGVCQGRVINLSDSYISFGKNNNILLAINFFSNINAMTLYDDIYIRFYTNSYYVNVAPQESLHTGTYVHNANAHTQYVNASTDIASFNGKSLVFKNGLYLPLGMPDVATLAYGDIVTYICDPTIYDITSQPITQLDTFTSSLDSAAKLILSIDSVENDIFVDDTEIFISGMTTAGVRIGAYFPRLDISFVRTLTYKDWSINANHLTARITELQSFKDVGQILSDIKVHLVRRDNGKYKPTILDTNAIADLMNLPTRYRKQALSGLNAVVPIWTADALESSYYNQWIQYEPTNPKIDDIFGVYSRVAAIDHLESVKRSPVGLDWSLPQLADVFGGTLVEYGANGVGVTLTPVPNNSGGTTYQNGYGYELFLPSPDNTGIIDIVVPANTVPVSTVYSAELGIFCYYRKGELLIPAIYQRDYDLVADGNDVDIVWSTDIQQYERYIRLAKNWISVYMNISVLDIKAGISVYGEYTVANDVGMSTLMVWANGRYQVEGIDYNVLNGKMYFVSKPTYWTDPFNLTFIYAGLPDLSLKHIPNTNNGFINHGTILNNNRYDLLMYRNNQFFLDGRAATLEMITDYENYMDKEHVIPPLAFTDGTPFAVVPKPYFISDNFLDLYTEPKRAEIERDIAISNYLSIIDPQVPEGGVIVIDQYYELISPFMDSILTDIVTGSFPYITDTLTEAQINAMCVPYFYLLQVDPCLKDIDSRFAIISPSWNTDTVGVSTSQYAFLNTINNMYLNNKVVGINKFVTILT